MNKFLVSSLIITSFILGIMFGYYMNPEYANLKSIATHDDLGAVDRYTDLRFINGMISHHQSAIYMLQQVLQNSDKQELHQLAKTIIELDTKGIQELYHLKKQIYSDQRLIKRFNAIKLGDKDKNFDLRFLNAMINHHEEAIKVSRDLMTKSFNTELLQLANDVSTLLSENLITLKEWRRQWYP